MPSEQGLCGESDSTIDTKTPAFFPSGVYSLLLVREYGYMLGALLPSIGHRRPAHHSQSTGIIPVATPRHATLGTCRSSLRHALFIGREAVGARSSNVAWSGLPWDGMTTQRHTRDFASALLHVLHAPIPSAPPTASNWPANSRAPPSDSWSSVRGVSMRHALPSTSLPPKIATAG